MHDDDIDRDPAALHGAAPWPREDAEDETLRRSRSRWVRWPAAVMAAILVVAAVGAAVVMFSRRLSRPECPGSGAADVDLRGRRLNDAERLLHRSEYRCGDRVVRIAVVSAVPCVRDRPGTIVRQGPLGFDGAERPVIRVEICDASEAA